MCSNIEIANGSNWLGLRLITSKIIILSSQIGVAHSRHGSLKWFQWNPVKCKLRDPNGEIWMAPEIADPLKRSLYNENFISTFNGIRMIPITPKPNRFDEPNGVRMKLLGKEGRRECARDRLKWISEESVQEEWPVGISSVNAQWEWPVRIPKANAQEQCTYSKLLEEPEERSNRIGPIKAESGGSRFGITFVMAFIVSYANELVCQRRSPRTSESRTPTNPWWFARSIPDPFADEDNRQEHIRFLDVPCLFNSLVIINN